MWLICSCASKDFLRTKYRRLILKDITLGGSSSGASKKFLFLTFASPGGFPAASGDTAKPNQIQPRIHHGKLGKTRLFLVSERHGIQALKILERSILDFGIASCGPAEGDLSIY
jgi:hypothetical protein